MRRFVLIAAAGAALLAGIAGTRQAPGAQPARGGEGSPSGPYQAPVELPHSQDPAINEASGIAASRRNPGIVWVHNDSGAQPIIFAVDRQGNTAAAYRVGGARAVDWEDIAYGPGPDGRGDFLYIGDIGDNNRTRRDCVVYRIPEPKIGPPPGTTPGIPQATRTQVTDTPTVRRAFRYPDGPHNAEALMVHPKTGVIYIVTKEENGVSRVYKFPSERGRRTTPAPVTLLRVGTVRIAGEAHLYPNLVTSGDIAPDGRKLVLCTYIAGYELTLPARARSFDAIWGARPVSFGLPLLPQCEAICYAPDGKSLTVTSEQIPALFYRLDAR